MSSWIDVTLAYSVLTGVLLLIVLFWSIVLYASIWQQWLWATAEEAVVKSEALGFSVEAFGLRPRLVMVGQYADKDLVIRWEGGIFGEYTTLIEKQRSVYVPIVKTSVELERALNDFCQTIVHSEPTSKPQIE